MSSADSPCEPRGWPLAAALTAAFFLAYMLRYVLLPFVLAAGLAYIVEPLVARLPRWFHIPRWLAATVKIALDAFYGAEPPPPAESGRSLSDHERGSRR